MTCTLHGLKCRRRFILIRESQWEELGHSSSFVPTGVVNDRYLLDKKMRSILDQ